MHIRAAQGFGINRLAGRRFYQGRSGEVDGAAAFHNHRLVRHRRNVGAAGRAGAHHRGDLRDSVGGHSRLIAKDSPEVVAVRKNFRLPLQERAAGIGQINARQPAGGGDFLRAQVLLDGQRIIRAALHGRVVGDDHAGAAANPTRPANNPGGGQGRIVNLVRRELTDFQKRRAGIQQRVDALARGHLAAGAMARQCGVAAAAQDHGDGFAQPLREAAQLPVVFAKRLGGGVDAGMQNHNPAPPIPSQPFSSRINSRPMSIRRISEVPAPISYNFASRRSRPAGKSFVYPFAPRI